MTIRKDKKFKHGEAIRYVSRPPSTLSKQDKTSIVDGFYKRAEAVKKPVTTVTKESINLANQTSANLQNDLVELSKLHNADKERFRNYAAAVIDSAKQKFERDHTGLPSILLADASNKPPTLEDYIRLGLSLAQLSEEERKSIQWMLDRSKGGK